MPSNEKQLLEKALGLSLVEVGLDWPQFQKDYGIRHEDPADEAADRAFFTWQRFRGEHRANSCLLDEEGRVRGLIIKESGLKSLRLPELPALEYLCVCENKQLEEIELAGKAYPLLQYMDWSNNALSAIRLTAELPLLAYLNVSRNKASQLQLPKALPALKEVDASHNQIRECTLPDVLPELAYLFLEGNGMTVLRTQAKLNALRTLNLRGNQLTELPKAEYAALETLYLKGNPLSGFGEDLLKGDKENGNAVEIIAALRSFAQTGERPNQRAKLIVVGNGRIGKTCLVKRLKGLPPKRLEDYTHGIAISELEKQHLPGVKTDELTLKVWDFGGQEVFYATHQFFMSEEAAYIYAWTDEGIARKNWENDEGKAPRAYHESDKWREHEYWLENIRMHGKDSPVVVVKTHCLDTRGTFPAERLKTAYALKHDPVDFDAFSPEPRYLENLAKAMTEALNRLPLLGQPIPRGFHDLVEKMDALRDEGVVELSKQDFLPLASACQIPEQDADAALGYLRKTGEVIHFPDSPRLRDKIYVNPDVLTKRAYKLIESNDHLTDEEGEFTTHYAKDCLGSDWEDLLELLISFQLIYRKKSGGSVIYIAPQYLPPLSKAGRNARNAFLGNERGKPLRFTLRYPQFLPENVMVNVLSEYGPYALDAVYRDAIFFCKEGQKEGCVIKADEGKREIQVYTTSSTAGNALAREVFEQFVTLSKKAALHIAVEAGEWVDVKRLDKGSSMTLPVEGSVDTYAKLSDFGFLRAERASSSTRDINIGLDSTSPKTYPKLDENIISVPMLNDISKGKGWAIEPNTPIHVLFTAATPSHAGKLNTGKESRLKDLIKEFDEEQRIVFQEEHGLDVEKFSNELFTKDPHVIHFAGHGEEEGLILEDDNLDGDVLVELVADLDNTRIVMLNACYTLPIAKELARYVPFVIGTQGKIPDDTAIAFARGFYVGLSSGKSIKSSFKYGLNTIKRKRLEGADIPILVIGERYFKD